MRVGRGNRLKMSCVFFVLQPWSSRSDCAKSRSLWNVHAKGASEPFSSLQESKKKKSLVSSVWVKACGGVCRGRVVEIKFV